MENDDYLEYIDPGHPIRNTDSEILSLRGDTPLSLFLLVDPDHSTGEVSLMMIYLSLTLTTLFFFKIMAPIIATVTVALMTNACEDFCGLKVHH